MSDIIFEDYSIQVRAAIYGRINSALEAAAGEVESQAKRNSKVGRVNGGKTKNSFQHKVDDSKNIAYIGSNDENAIWEEFGTGEYALEGKGRKGGWYIPIGAGGISQAVVDAYGMKVVYGKNGKKYAYTKGKKPKRALYKAFQENKESVKNVLMNALKGI